MRPAYARLPLADQHAAAFLFQTTKELPEFLPPSAELDAPKMEDAILASDLGSLLKDDCRRVARRRRTGDGRRLSAAWSRHQEASAWRDRLSLARRRPCAADLASRQLIGHCCN